MALFSKTRTRLIDRLPEYARAVSQQGLQDVYDQLVLGRSPLLAGARGLAQRELAGEFLSPATNLGFAAYLNALRGASGQAMGTIAERGQGLSADIGGLQQRLVAQPLAQNIAGLTAQNFATERARRLQTAMEVPQLAAYGHTALQNYLNALRGTRDVVTYRKRGFLGQVAPIIGAIAGGMMGGPAGAAAGASLGGTIGGSL
jgi:hypothetical protein